MIVGYEVVRRRTSGTGYARVLRYLYLLSDPCKVLNDSIDNKKNKIQCIFNLCDKHRYVVSYMVRGLQILYNNLNKAGTRGSF